jgi:ketosteroid isomerase-like protein
MRSTFDGKEVRMPGIRVMRVRDGLIVSSKDYGNNH